MSIFANRFRIAVPPQCKLQRQFTYPFWASLKLADLIQRLTLKGYWCQPKDISSGDSFRSSWWGRSCGALGFQVIHSSWIQSYLCSSVQQNYSRIWSIWVIFCKIMPVGNVPSKEPRAKGLLRLSLLFRQFISDYFHQNFYEFHIVWTLQTPPSVKVWFLLKT